MASVGESLAIWGEFPNLTGGFIEGFPYQDFNSTKILNFNLCANNKQKIVSLSTFVKPFPYLPLIE
jgi:hypothetical protein